MAKEEIALKLTLVVFEEIKDYIKPVDSENPLELHKNYICNLFNDIYGKLKINE